MQQRRLWGGSVPRQCTNPNNWNHHHRHHHRRHHLFIDGAPIPIIHYLTLVIIICICIYFVSWRVCSKLSDSCEVNRVKNWGQQGQLRLRASFALRLLAHASHHILFSCRPKKIFNLDVDFPNAKISCVDFDWGAVDDPSDNDEDADIWKLWEEVVKQFTLEREEEKTEPWKTRRGRRGNRAGERKTRKNQYVNCGSWTGKEGLAFKSHIHWAECGGRLMLNDWLDQKRKSFSCWQSPHRHIWLTHKSDTVKWTQTSVFVSDKTCPNLKV